MLTVRLARFEDLTALPELIPASVRALSQGYYHPLQSESAIRHVFGPDTRLIADGTYYVAEADGTVVGMRPEQDPLLDPDAEAARIRAFFVHPEWARRGIASQIMDACVEAARAAGFQRLELMATLPGEPLYRAFGFMTLEQVDTLLPDGVSIPFVRMTRAMDE